MNDPAGWAGNLLVMVNTSPLGCVAQLGEVKVNPLSVPASRGKAWSKLKASTEIILLD